MIASAKLNKTPLPDEPKTRATEGSTCSKPTDLVSEAPCSPGPARPTWKDLLRKYCVDPFVGSMNPPWFDARGIAVGLAVGFGVPIGAQMVVLALLRSIFRFNSVVAFAFTWVNNPITLLPMYYGYYYFGSLVLDRPISLTGESFHQLMVPIIHADHFWHSIAQFMSLGFDVLLRWTVSAVILGVISGLLGYLIGLKVQKVHCMNKAKTMGITYDKLLENLERSVRKADAP